MYIKLFINWASHAMRLTHDADHRVGFRVNIEGEELTVQINPASAAGARSVYTCRVKILIGSHRTLCKWMATIARTKTRSSIIMHSCLESSQAPHKLTNLFPKSI